MIFIEKPYKFISSDGFEYEFGIYSKNILNENLILGKQICVQVLVKSNMCMLSMKHYYWFEDILEGSINNIKIWKIKYPKLSEEFRLYLQKFIKLPVFF